MTSARSVPPVRHRWDLSPREAAALQRELAGRVMPLGDAPKLPYVVAGCDATGSGCWSRRDEQILAGIVVLQVPGFERLDLAWVRRPSPFPYVPGLLSFREAPLYVEAFAKLRVRPDLLLCDGQGLAHPRGLGLACHLGLLLDTPTVGVAKSRLVGTYREPGARRGCSTRLLLQGRLVGRVVRTQAGVRPLFVSPGHRIGIAQAAQVAIDLAPRYRLPEPTRQADAWVGALRRAGARA